MSFSAIVPEGLYQAKSLSAGVVASNRNDTSIVSFAAEEKIAWGNGVRLGSSAGLIDVFDVATGTNFRGVAIVSPQAGISTNAAGGGVDTQNYAIGDAVGVIEKGVVAVVVNEAVTLKSAVRVRSVTSGAKIAGTFEKTADTGKTSLLTATCAQWVSETSGSGVALLWLSGPFTVTAD